MKPDDDVDVNRKALRELLVKSFGSDELQNLCFDYFPDLYNRVEGNFGKHVVARLLIDYCERHGLIKYLLALVKENNPYQYTLFEEALLKPAPPPLASGDQPTTILKLTFPNIKLEDFTPDKQAALIELIAEELNVSPADVTILDIRSGSVIITLRLPARAAAALLAMQTAGHPVLQDLQLGHIESIPLRLPLWQRLIKFARDWLGWSNNLLTIIVTGLLLTGLSLLVWQVWLGQSNSQPQTTLPEAAQFVFVTPTPTPTVVPTSTPSPAPTLPPPTDAPTATSTPLPTSTLTPSPTFAPTDTATLTPSATFTPTPTSTFLPMPTVTFSPTPSLTPSATATITPTPTPTVTPSPNPDANHVAVEGPEKVKAGQSFVAVVSIRQIAPPGVFGAQFSLVYTPDDLAIVELTPNPELLVVVQSIDNQLGQLDFAASRSEGVPNFTDDVVFVAVTFEAKRFVHERDFTPTDKQTEIKLVNVKLGAKGGLDIPASTQDLVLVIEP